MLFSSIVFLFYFLPIILLLYYACFWSKRVQNALLLIASLFFYAWGEPYYVFLMLGSILFNYVMAIFIDGTQKKKLKKALFFITLSGNIGVLFLFKYLGFVIRSMNEAAEGLLQIKEVSFLLPIGISFFTFQAMSYVIDVYKKEAKVQKNVFYLGLYISFFPQLVAGPIVRYTTIENQIFHRKETVTKFSVGSCRFIVGLSKKLLIANQMAAIADHIFAMNQVMPTTLAWLGAIAYTIQIYFDFSGYSDMAIGLSLMFGFQFPENFNYPYISRSISEFWRRWHISVGTWFREYVYFPLGGSRVINLDYLVRNLFIVWLLTGIWHGAEWTFWIWGIYNFLFVMIEKLTGFEKRKLRFFNSNIYTMVIVVIGWVIFRSVDLVHAGSYLYSMFTVKGGFFSDTAAMFLRENIVFFLCGIAFSIPIARTTNEYMMQKRKGTIVFELLYPVVMMILLFLCVTYLVKGTYNPFIYFNF